jgi:hypothetical protein
MSLILGVDGFFISTFPSSTFSDGVITSLLPSIECMWNPLHVAFHSFIFAWLIANESFCCVFQVKVWCIKQEASVINIDMKANICSVKYNPGSSCYVAACFLNSWLIY